MKETILFFMSSMILAYLILQYHMKQINRKFITYFIGLTLFLFLFFVIISSDNLDLNFIHENFTNGIDEPIDEDLSGELSGEMSGELSGEMSGELSGELSGYIHPVVIHHHKKKAEEKKKHHPIVKKKAVDHKKASEVSGEGHSQETSGQGEVSGVSHEEPSGKPDMNNIIFDHPTTGNAYGPLNINISYKNEGGDGEGGRPSCKITNPYMDNIDDMGKYNYKTRVHNNKNWMNTWQQSNYGDQAWTLDPDYYIPSEGAPTHPPPPPPQPIIQRPQFQNELNYRYNETKEKCAVCPLEVNTPWSEYKTGDKEPEGFNL